MRSGSSGCEIESGAGSGEGPRAIAGRFAGGGCEAPKTAADVATHVGPRAMGVVVIGERSSNRGAGNGVGCHARTCTGAMAVAHTGVVAESPSCWTAVGVGLG